MEVQEQISLEKGPKKDKRRFQNNFKPENLFLKFKLN
jgi:hypothetical protein